MRRPLPLPPILLATLAVLAGGCWASCGQGGEDLAELPIDRRLAEESGLALEPARGGDADPAIDATAALEAARGFLGEAGERERDRPGGGDRLLRGAGIPLPLLGDFARTKAYDDLVFGGGRTDERGRPLDPFRAKYSALVVDAMTGAALFQRSFGMMPVDELRITMPAFRAMANVTHAR